MNKPKEFITFGFGQSIGGKSLADHYMVINRKDAEEVIEKHKDGFLQFAFSYPLKCLQDQLERFPQMKEITKEEYMRLKKNG